MLEEVMRHIRNDFHTEVRKEGSFTISDGTISLDFIPDNAYIRIEGSIFNDGVYKYPVSSMMDETFDGVITLLAPPKAFMDLVEEIESYQATAKPTTLVSESFGGYSYTNATTANGNMASWQNAFGTRLNAWRKV